MNTVRYQQAPDAEQTVARLAAPQLGVAASAIAGALPGNVPVRRKGFFRSHYAAAASGPSGDPPTARVGIQSPYWHWLEYGNAQGVPAARPVQSTVTGLGIRFVAK